MKILLAWEEETVSVAALASASLEPWLQHGDEQLPSQLVNQLSALAFLSASVFLSAFFFCSVSAAAIAAAFA